MLSSAAEQQRSVLSNTRRVNGAAGLKTTTKNWRGRLRGRLAAKFAGNIHQLSSFRLCYARAHLDLRGHRVVQGHPGYKNLHFRPKSLGVMCGPPPFGELGVLTRGIRFTFFWRLKSLATTKLFGLGHAGPHFFKKGCFFQSTLSQDPRVTRDPDPKARAWEMARLPHHVNQCPYRTEFGNFLLCWHAFR